MRTRLGVMTVTFTFSFHLNTGSIMIFTEGGMQKHTCPRFGRSKTCISNYVLPGLETNIALPLLRTKAAAKTSTSFHVLLESAKVQNDDRGKKFV
jgi:hypothetical protein